MTLNLNTDIFLYDISSLIRAFYPGEDMKIGNGCREQDSQPVINIDLKEYVQVSISQNGKIIYEKKEPAKGLNNFCSNKERREYKNLVKRLLFEGLCLCTNKTPSWGILTGVRPTKLAMERLILGESKEEAASFLEENYLCNPGKSELAAGIAGKELAILRKIGWQEGYSLYIGIPFCPTTCSYCSFASHSLEKFSGLVEDYLASLYVEIDAMAEFMKGKKLSCIYFGGGTPTALGARQLDELIFHVKEMFPMENVQEFTVEAGRPDSITKEKLIVLKKHNIDRISINPQTMRDDTLNRIGRKHSAEKIRECFFMAREMGFDNINMDIIVGLPGETVEDVEYTLKEVLKMSPDSLTVHSMVLKRAARLNLTMTAKEGSDSESINKMVELGYEYAAKMGMEPYYMYRQKNASGSLNESRDNIGYAKPGKEGIYNIIIMEEKQSILALGAGATTKRVFPDGSIERCENVKDAAHYIKRTDEMIERKRRLLDDM